MWFASYAALYRVRTRSVSLRHVDSPELFSTVVFSGREFFFLSANRISKNVSLKNNRVLYHLRTISSWLRRNYRSVQYTERFASLSIVSVVFDRSRTFDVCVEIYVLFFPLYVCRLTYTTVANPRRG